MTGAILALIVYVGYAILGRWLQKERAQTRKQNPGGETVTVGTERVQLSRKENIMSKPKLDGESLILYAVLREDGQLIGAGTEFDDAHRTLVDDDLAKYLVCLDVTVTDTEHVQEIS